MKLRPLLADGIHPLNCCTDGEVREGSSVYRHYSSVLTPSGQWEDEEKNVEVLICRKANERVLDG